MASVFSPALHLFQAWCKCAFFFKLPVYQVLFESFLPEMLSNIFPTWDLSNGKQMAIVYSTISSVEGFCTNYLTWLPLTLEIWNLEKWGSCSTHGRPSCTVPAGLQLNMRLVIAMTGNSDPGHPGEYICPLSCPWSTQQLWCTFWQLHMHRRVAWGHSSHY